MLINALCNYYDMLAEMNEVLPDGYSTVKIHYQVCLTPDGIIKRIDDCQEDEMIKMPKGKEKSRRQPISVKMTKRSEKPGIDANIIEHRPLYLFGLNYTDGTLTTQDRTGKARKSHEDFVKKNLSFLEGLDSPVINAYRRFVQSWNPEEETENVYLLGLGKAYASSGFSFYLSGHPEAPLHEDEQLNAKWEQMKNLPTGKDARMSQCAVMGEKLPIARIHGKIKGVAGGLATGTLLVSYKNPSESSYGNEQSYNSNISELAMKKYTEALNYLLSNKNHRTILDDVTVVYWSVSKNTQNDTLLAALMFGNQEGWNREQTDAVLKSIMTGARKGKVTAEELKMEQIDPDVDFYILGLKPNSSRISLKFLYHRKVGDILYNIARHQMDMQVTEEIRPVSLSQIEKELLAPKSKNDKVAPALLTKIMEAVLYGTQYPEYLFATIVRRVKTDVDIPFHVVRAGIIKAYLNRRKYLRGEKEELKVALDKENTNEAYLCGRLFAVLEQLQRSASKGKLNRTIKDAYFSSAPSKPAIIFPKLLKLAQNHMNKSTAPVFYNQMICEIMGKFGTSFPETLSLVEQGNFMIGYYQQTQEFFEKNKKKDEVQTDGNE